jgi:hypothetical protein
MRRSAFFQRRQADDQGVSLVLALLFITLVGLFATVALTKAQNTTLSGVHLRERGQLQYTLDAAVERALQVTRTDMADTDPSQCAQPASPTATGSVSLNGVTSDWTCTLLAGRAKKSSDDTTTDYAVVVTSPSAGALTTQSGASSDVMIGGSAYVNGAVSNSDLNKQIGLTTGDYVSPFRAGWDCDAALTALTDVSVATGFLKTCTEQSLADALPTVALPTAPVFDVSALFPNGVDVVTKAPKKTDTTCRVFYPGKYTTAPGLLNGANYFVSGVYYFSGIGTWTFDGNNLSVTGGQRAVAADSATLNDDCKNMDDATALGQSAVATVLASIQPATFTNGVTWVLGGSSRISMPKGRVTLFTPPVGGSSQPVNLVALGSAASGYAAIGAGPGTPIALNGMSNSTEARFNAKVYAPSASIDIFSTNKTEAVARGGVVAYELALQASVSGGDGLAISAAGGVANPPPPFRTIKIVSVDSSGGSSGTNTAVATISNFAPYSVKTKSWRTGD